MKKKLFVWLLALWLGPAQAVNQSTTVTPTSGPHSASDFTTNFLNPALQAIFTCNWGPSAPLNGPGAAPGLYECWANTTANPVVFNRWDGASWVPFGTLDTTAHVWTGQSSVLVTAPPATKTTSYTMLSGDSSLIFNGAGTLTLTLLSAASFPGRWLTIKTIAAQTVVSATSNVVPRATATAGTAILPATAGAWVSMQSDGTNWVIMEGTP